jgi:murein DD-endopeptidase MepM/ murein hydrolase activator NlpD
VRLTRIAFGVTIVVSLLAPLVAAPVGGTGCLSLRPPVDGPVVRPFAPVGTYGGHWGADLAVPAGTVAVAQAPGVVSFSGSVAGTEAVTVDHGGGLRTTVSSVAVRLVATGAVVARSTPIALTGSHDDRDAVHASARVDGTYVDPVPLWRCIPATPGPGLRLVPVP